MRKCKAVARKSGERCRNNADYRRAWCWAHNPKRIAARAPTRKRHSKKKAEQRLAAACEALEDVILGLTVESRTGVVLSEQANEFRQAFEEWKQRI